MTTDKIPVPNLRDALEMVALLDTQIKAYRSVYKQIRDAYTGANEDQVYAALREVEHAGMKLAQRQSDIIADILQGMYAPPPIR